MKAHIFSSYTYENAEMCARLIQSVKELVKNMREDEGMLSFKNTVDKRKIYEFVNERYDVGANIG